MSQITLERSKVNKVETWLTRTSNTRRLREIVFQEATKFSITRPKHQFLILKTLGVIFLPILRGGGTLQRKRVNVGFKKGPNFTITK